jgi:hypothetical protein
MNEVRKDLEGINGQSPYTNRVALVSRDLITPNAINVYPAIVMLEEQEEFERSSSTQRLFLTANLTLLIYYQPSAGEVVSTALNSLAADVKYAMISSTQHTHDNKAHHTLYRGRDSLAVPNTGVAGIVMDFGLNYSHTWDTP